MAELRVGRNSGKTGFFGSPLWSWGRPRLTRRFLRGSPGPMLARIDYLNGPCHAPSGDDLWWSSRAGSFHANVQRCAALCRRPTREQAERKSEVEKQRRRVVQQTECRLRPSPHDHRRTFLATHWFRQPRIRKIRCSCVLDGTYEGSWQLESERRTKRQARKKTTTTSPRREGWL
jgi:hypothetical protein